MASPRLSPAPLASPMVAQDGTPSPVWARWLQQLQAQFPSIVLAECSTAAGQSIPSGTVTVVNFDTVSTDTDGAVTTGASWHWTCPAGKGGVYAISAGVAVVSTAGNPITDQLLGIYKNGNIDFRHGTRNDNANSTGLTFGSVVGFQTLLAAGDTIDARIYQNGGAAHFLETLAASNWISIARIGSL